MALRDHIKENHDLAEKHPFVKLLFSGGVSSELYADYLFNQYVMYNKLESLALEKGLLDGVEEVVRSELMLEDLIELNQHGMKLRGTTMGYIKYLQERVPEDKIMAHIYVRHFGDLFGGQLMKKVIPGSGKMYDFENRSELIKKLRERLDDSLADEANDVMIWAISLFSELANDYDIQWS